jgi:hypothetical protein
MKVDLHERVLGHRGRAGQAKPHVDQNPLTHFRGVTIIGTKSCAKHPQAIPLIGTKSEV